MALQFILVYVGTVYCFISFKNTTPLEVFGLATLVCSQTFGLVFVVVKYFFGQKPEGLSEIMRFIYKTYPNPPYFSVPDKKLDSNI